MNYENNVSRDNNTWETPIGLFNDLNKEFEFTLDPCCSEETKKCDKYYTEKEDGLIQDWSKDTVFMNPPHMGTIPMYGLKKHMKKVLRVLQLFVLYQQEQTQVIGMI